MGDLCSWLEADISYLQPKLYQVLDDNTTVQVSLYCSDQTQTVLLEWSFEVVVSLLALLPAPGPDQILVSRVGREAVYCFRNYRAFGAVSAYRGRGDAGKSCIAGVSLMRLAELPFPVSALSEHLS